MEFILDINTQGLTFITRESYFKRNYFINNITELSQESYYKLLTKDILMNLRTYDENSLILHANDNLNNFVQLFIMNGNSVVFVFNHFHKIYNITVKYPGISYFIYNSSLFINLVIQYRIKSRKINSISFGEKRKFYYVTCE